MEYFAKIIHKYYENYPQILWILSTNIMKIIHK